MGYPYDLSEHCELVAHGYETEPDFVNLESPTQYEAACTIVRDEMHERRYHQYKKMVEKQYRGLCNPLG